MRILFIGNSHTYANGLPFQVRAMIDSTEGEGTCEAHMITPGGKSLEWHAREPGTQQMITCNAWDTIVLQQQTHPFPPYAELEAAYDKLKRRLERAGAEVLLYVTWSRKGQPEDQVEIDCAFEKLAAKEGCAVVPVSTAWHRVLAELPDVDLYRADGSHAGPAGTYTAACVFYSVLIGESPEGVPACIEAGGETLVDLDADVAVTIQRIAWEVVQP